VDGKTFARQLGPDGKSGMFSEGRGNNTRDPMVLRVGGRYYCYYTAYPDKKGAVYCRTTRDFRRWSDSKIVAFGGSAGPIPTRRSAPWSCTTGTRATTISSAPNATARRPDQRLPVEGSAEFRHRRRSVPCDPPAGGAPEIISYQGSDYIAALRPGLDGIQIAKLKWRPK